MVESKSILYQDFIPPQELLEKIISLSPKGIIGINRKGDVVIFNEAAEKLTGLKREDVLGKISIIDIYHSLESARYVKKKMHGSDFGGPGRLGGLEVKLKTKEGVIIPIHLSALILTEDGVEVGSLGFFHDLSEQRGLEEELRKLSITDDLTGLYTRRHFYMVLSQEISRCLRHNDLLTVAYFDLDRFKSFNDSFGHQEGDKLLSLVGECAHKFLRKYDYSFRLGGDEFALIFAETDLGGASIAVERFRKAFNQRCQNAMSHLGETVHPITMSLGLTQFDNKDTVESLVKRADLAMYEAKNIGGDAAFKVDPRIGRLSDDRENIPGMISMHSTEIAEAVNPSHSQETLKDMNNTRRNSRKRVKTSGHFINVKDGKGGAIMVEDVSTGGIGFRTLMPHDLAANDVLEVRFKIDDEGAEELLMRVIVRYTMERRIGAQVCESDEHDGLWSQRLVWS